MPAAFGLLYLDCDVLVDVVVGRGYIISRITVENENAFYTFKVGENNILDEIEFCDIWYLDLVHSIYGTRTHAYNN